jgi:hypothetical protein
MGQKKRDVREGEKRCAGLKVGQPREFRLPWDFSVAAENFDLGEPH